MASFNRVILVGNLTRDIELRYTPQGTAVTDIGLAVNERVKRNNEWVDEVNFFDVTLWGRTAEVAGEYLSKGSSILIEGRLKLDRWEQQDGAKRSKIKIIGERMQMLGGKQGGQGGATRGPYNQAAGQPQSHGGQTQNAPAPPAPAQGPPDDDIPF